MTVESVNYVADLDPVNPAAGDYRFEGDDHIRNIKKALKNTFKTTTGKQYDLDDIVRDLMPAGAITLWYGAGDNIPTGWVLCNGQTVSKLDGSGNITTPNLVNRFIRGAGLDGSGFPAHEVGGAKEKTVATTAAAAHNHSVPTTSEDGSHTHGAATGPTALTVAQMPSHNHGGGGHTHQIYAVDASGTPATQGDFTYYNEEVKSTASNPVIHDSLYNTSGSGTIVSTQGSGAAHSHTITAHGAHTHTIANTGNAGGHSHDITINVEPQHYALCYIMKR